MPGQLANMPVQGQTALHRAVASGSEVRVETIHNHDSHAMAQNPEVMTFPCIECQNMMQLNDMSHGSVTQQVTRHTCKRLA